MQPLDDPSLFSSKKSLIQELEAIVSRGAAEADRPWMSRSILCQRFEASHGLELEELVKRRGYAKDLKGLLLSSGQFAIYNSPRPEEFYTALFRIVLPAIPKAKQISPKPRLNPRRRT